MKTKSHPRKTALLINFVPPYRIPLFLALQKRLKELAIYVSTPMEANRSWKVDWHGLNVVIQKNLTLKRPWHHPHGFSEPLYLHFPYDTLMQLFKFSPSFVISGELGLRTLFSTIYRKITPKARLVIWATLSEHTEQNRGRLRLMLRKWLLHQADAVLVNGESGARYIRSFGVDDCRIVRFPQPVDHSTLYSLPLERTEAQAQRLLYVGRLIEMKGLVPFLTALRRWCEEHPDRHFEFWLLGDGPERATLEGIKLPPNLSVLYLGEVEYHEIYKAYAEGGILAFPTMADEWGLVVNEAMAAGLPVLGSLYSQAVEELVEEGRTGWVFHPDRPEEVYAAIGRALSTSPETLAKMRIPCRAKVAELTPENSALKLLQTLETLT